MYKSEEEKKLRKQYIIEEIKSLHPSLQRDIDIPIGTYLSADSQWIGRLDLLKSGIHRFSMYKQGVIYLPCPILQKQKVSIELKVRKQTSILNLRMTR